MVLLRHVPHDEGGMLYSVISKWSLLMRGYNLLLSMMHVGWLLEQNIPSLLGQLHLSLEIYNGCIYVKFVLLLLKHCSPHRRISQGGDTCPPPHLYGWAIEQKSMCHSGKTYNSHQS